MVTAHYDNSVNNKFNPDTSKTVYYGDYDLGRDDVPVLQRRGGSRCGEEAADPRRARAAIRRGVGLSTPGLAKRLPVWDALPTLPCLVDDHGFGDAIARDVTGRKELVITNRLGDITERR